MLSPVPAGPLVPSPTNKVVVGSEKTPMKVRETRDKKGSQPHAADWLGWLGFFFLWRDL